MKNISIKIPSANISAIQHGNNQNQPTIIAVHGWLDNAASFIPLMSQLPEYNWIAIDLPGHGASDHRPDGCYYHFIDWVDDLVQIIKSLKIDKPVLLGHSLGGFLSTVVAGLYPELLSKLILIDAAGLITQDETNVIGQMRQAFESRSLVRSKNKRTHKNIESAIKARQKAGGISAESAQLLVARNTHEISGEIVWKTDIRLNTGSPLRVNRFAAEQIIAAITAETLIVLAKDGFESMREGYAQYKSFYKTASKVEVAGHHHCHLDNSAETAEQIKLFLL